MSDFAVFPRSLIIEPTVACNRTCPFCPRTNYDVHKSGYMDMALFQRLMDEIAHYRGRTIHLFRRGESLLHPKIVEMFEYARPRADDIQLTTNGTLLTHRMSDVIIDLLDFISFSIDTPGRYEVNRGGVYDDTVANIDYLLEKARGKKIGTQISVVRTDHTDAEIDWFIARWEPFVDRVRVYDLHSADGHYGSLPYDRGPRRPCMKPFSEILIYYDGLTGRCNHDWNGKPIGSVANATIRDVWMSAAYDDLRGQHRTLDIKDETCRHCDSWYPTIWEQGTGQLVANEADAQRRQRLVELGRARRP
jgi:pyruvate-formate lyase-activating enzyme